MPVFPYPPNVQTDLRDLFRLDRQNRTARDLGASSITRGEGSMDLYETDDGPVVGRYGDLPDGSFGVGFLHRGAFWNVSDLIGTAQDDITAHGTRLGSLEGRMTGAEGRLGTAEGRLDSHATRIGGAEGRLDAHAGRLGDAEGRLDAHAGRIGATESKNATQDGRLDSHGSRIGSVESVNGSQNGRLDAHAQRIGALEGQPQIPISTFNALADEVAAVKARIAALENWRDNHLINHAPDLIP